MAVVAAACTSGGSPVTANPPPGSSSASPPSATPPRYSLPSAPTSHTVTPPLITCGGQSDYHFDGSQKPAEICIGLARRVTITVTIPSGEHWDAPMVTDPGLLVTSDAGVSNGTSHITVRGVETGASSITISSGGAVVWTLLVAISR
jgi:hypothetical protein